MTIKSKTKIEAQLTGKTNPELIETVILAKKNAAWNELAGLLTTPGRNKTNVNLTVLENIDAEAICVPGKVLSDGIITKKKKIIAFKFSEKAEKKLKAAGCETVLIKDEIKNNKEMKGVAILRK